MSDDRALLISVTRLRLASARPLPRFLWHALRAARQARAAPGCRGLRLLADRGLAFWTATAWDGEAALKRFGATGAHRAAMPLMARWCDEGAVVRFIGPPGSLDDWAALHDRLLVDGVPTPVPRPSPAQRARAWPPPRPAMFREVAIGPGGRLRFGRG